jgi:hypothetical protein
MAAKFLSDDLRQQRIDCRLEPMLFIFGHGTSAHDRDL